MTEQQFEEFLDNCYDEMEIKQKQLLDNYSISSYTNYWFKGEEGILQFKNGDDVMMEFKVSPIGSWSSASDSWMWAWANKSLTEENRQTAMALKGLTEHTGLDTFERPVIEGDEGLAHELVAMAIHHMGGIGMYIMPHENLKVFVALMEVI